MKGSLSFFFKEEKHISAKAFPFLIFTVCDWGLCYPSKKYIQKVDAVTNQLGHILPRKLFVLWVSTEKSFLCYNHVKNFLRWYVETKKILLFNEIKQSWNAVKSSMAKLGLAVFVTDLNLISSAGGACKRHSELLPSKPVMKWAIPRQMRLKDYFYNLKISCDLTEVKKDFVLSTSNPSYSLIKSTVISQF